MMNIEQHKKYFSGKICQYCDTETELVDSAEIYQGKSYGWAYICRNCGAYVGCHKFSKLSLGMVANVELRLEKRRAHHYFDQLWKGKWFKTRIGAYRWLAKKLNIPNAYMHIGMSDVEQCRVICDICIDKMKRMNQQIIPFEDSEGGKTDVIDEK